MIKTLKILTTALFIILMSYLSYNLFVFIAKKYFFDKFFYKKSVEYGYWYDFKKVELNDFGDRSADISDLISFAKENTEKILYSNMETTESPMKTKVGDISDHPYTIVVIGDSYVWGEGVKTEERFSTILEKELNEIRPTKVISLGIGGDNVFENYVKWLYSKSLYPNQDLVIFGVVSNDLLINKPSRYSKSLINDFLNRCTGEIVLSPTYKEEAIAAKNNIDLFAERTKRSVMADTKNHCAYELILSYFPKENSMYVDFDSFRIKWKLIKEITEPLYKNGFYIVDPESIYLDEYSQKVKHEDLFVSKKDEHPSAITHQIYSKTIIKELLNNPKWKFYSN